VHRTKLILSFIYTPQQGGLSIIIILSKKLRKLREQETAAAQPCASETTVLSISEQENSRRLQTKHKSPSRFSGRGFHKL